MVLWAAPGAAGIADVVDGSDVLSAAASRAVEHRAGMASGGVLALHVRRRDRDSGRGRRRQRRGHSAQPLRRQLDDGVGISMLIAGFVGAAAWLVLMVLLPVGLTIRRPPPPAPGWAFHPYPPPCPTGRRELRDRPPRRCAVGVPDEGGAPKSSGWYSGQSRRGMQRFGAHLERSLMKRLYRVVVGGGERDMDLPIGSPTRRPQLSRRPACRHAHTDGLAEVHQTRIAQHAEHPVVKHLRFGVVSAIEPK